ncbi:MAG: hypothetical protein MRJ68_19170 [Nitrospira sp.]|nr:hypothetical protein [Nitrospira sp.]
MRTLRKLHSKTRQLALQAWKAVFPFEAEDRETARKVRRKVALLKKRMEGRTNHSLDYFEALADSFFDRRVKTFGWAPAQRTIAPFTTLDRDPHLNLWFRGELNLAKRWLSAEITRLATKRHKKHAECELLRVRLVQRQQVQDALIDYAYVHALLKNVKRRRCQGSTIQKRSRTRERNLQRKNEIAIALHQSRLAIGKKPYPPIIRKPGESGAEAYHRQMAEERESSLLSSLHADE